MSIVRVIPKLDIKGPNLIKGIEFDGHRVLGNVEDFAEMYYKVSYKLSFNILEFENKYVGVIKKL